MNLKTFYINQSRIRYQEAVPDDGPFEKCYLIENPLCEDIVAIPDGCIDLQFTWTDQVCRGYVCGSFLQGRRSLTSTYERCFGLKLHPGVLFAFLQCNRVDSLMDSRVPLENFLDIRRLEEELAPQTQFSDLIETALRFFRDQRIFPAHAIAGHADHFIRKNMGAVRVSELIQSLGYSHRYVNNVFKNHFGVSVKKYADIIRAQAAIDYLGSSDIMDVIVDLGYYDQAHFIRDFKQYTSMTPNAFLVQIQKNAGLIIV